MPKPQKKRQKPIVRLVKQPNIYMKNMNEDLNKKTELANSKKASKLERKSTLEEYKNLMNDYKANKTEICEEFNISNNLIENKIESKPNYTLPDAEIVEKEMPIQQSPPKESKIIKQELSPSKNIPYFKNAKNPHEIKNDFRKALYDKALLDRVLKQRKDQIEKVNRIIKNQHKKYIK